MSKIHILFDGPPGPEAGRFVEVERDGQSIRFGEMKEREDGYWVLEIPDQDAALAALREEVERLRDLLFHTHPCQGMYGDDGERQCNACQIDFKRMPISELESRLMLGDYGLDDGPSVGKLCFDLSHATLRAEVERLRSTVEGLDVLANQYLFRAEQAESEARRWKAEFEEKQRSWAESDEHKNAEALRDALEAAEGKIEKVKAWVVKSMFCSAPYCRGCADELEQILK